MLMRSREGISRQSVNHYTLVFESTIVKGAEFGIENPSENPSRNGCPILHDIGKKNYGAVDVTNVSFKAVRTTTYLTDRITTDWSSTRGVLHT